MNTIEQLKAYEPLFWTNPNKSNSIEPTISLEALMEADLRIKKFAPFFEKIFSVPGGNIESPLTKLEGFPRSIIPFIGGKIIGDWYVKEDNALPISGSIKARGGVYEVLKIAETLVLENGLINAQDSYVRFYGEDIRSFLSQYTLVVGSTGNLGLSIGTIGRALGFCVQVHMSNDAKPWKIQLLGEKGAEVVLHPSDYSKAVEEGRKKALANPFARFIDDENSLDLFTGYAVAALRLKTQLDAQGLSVDENHPLFVYLPCGVGGAPGGIAYGLKLLFGQHVYLFFAEPTHAPCMLLGMATEKHDAISIKDIGLDGITLADGLAVGRASGFVGKVMSPIIDGIYTVSDDTLSWLQYILSQSDGIRLEPSALAGFMGPVNLLYNSTAFEEVLIANNLLDKMAKATHISWSTGGNMVPPDIMAEDIKKGQSIKMSSLI